MAPSMPDLVMLCAAYGVKGIRVSDPSELKDAIALMLSHDGPVMVDVQVRKDENCYPMVAPGKSNAEMIGLPDRKNLQRAMENS